MGHREETDEQTFDQTIVPVILAGGQGTRLWPLSRSTRPKQFLPLTGDQSLFQLTLKRTANRALYAPAVVVTNANYRFLVAEQAAESGIEVSTVMLEPEARNTAMAVTAAAAHVAARFGDNTLMHVLPSDHALEAGRDYTIAVHAAALAAAQGFLVTFGIEPTAPETAFGYIKAGTPLRFGARSVSRFVEKPDRPQAERLLREGGYLWNSGMFMVEAGAFLEEMALLAPDIVIAAHAALDNATTDPDFLRLDASAFAGGTAISIDRAMFERTTRAAVVPSNFTWSDLGSWDALWKMSSKDPAGNVGYGSITLRGARNVFAMSDQGHVVVDGLDDVAVVATEDAIYVGRLSLAQEAGTIVAALRADTRTAALTEHHRTSHRPWGGYSTLLCGERFKVKRLFVKPGQRLSLQKHHHRAEHWVVVHGTAVVTIDGQDTILSENQSIFLPLGCEHRLHNPGKIRLELIEIQVGSYIDEDDIVRIADEYDRA